MQQHTMKIEITTATVVAVVALASVHDSAAFSRNAHKTTHCRVAFGRTNNHPCTTALDASFDDETEDEPQKKKGFFANFFEELDAFVDDATSRRLGAGAQYYGKRKSSFYGKDDPNKKKDKVSARRCLVRERMIQFEA